MAINQHTVLIRVKQLGAKTVRKNLGGLGTALSMVGLAAAGMTAAIVRSSDEMTNLANKSRVFAKSNDQAANRMATVISVARTMNMQLSGVADVMQRVSMSADQVGLSNEQVTKMVSNLAKATMLSGATSQEATGALRQFGQALAANRLSGQELNSVLEQTPMIARIIADSMGVAVGELRALGKEGRITATVMKDALAGSIDDLDAKFDKFEFPIAALLVSIRREAVILIDNFSKLTNAGQALRDMAQSLADYLTDLNRSFVVGGETAQEFTRYVNLAKDAVVALGIAMATYLTGSAIGSVTKGVSKASGAMAKLAVMASNIKTPWAILAAGVVGAGVALVQFFSKTTDLEVAKKPVESLESLELALADISNMDLKGIKFWQKEFNALGLSIEEFEKLLRDKRAKFEEVTVGIKLGTVQRGDFDTIEEAVKARADNLRNILSEALNTAIESGVSQEAIENIQNQLAAVTKEYEDFVKKREALDESLRGYVAPLTATAFSDLVSDYAPISKQSGIIQDISTLQRAMKEFSDAGRMTEVNMMKFRSTSEGMINALLKLIPVNEHLGAGFDRTSSEFQVASDMAKVLGVELDALPEYIKRFSEENAALANQPFSVDRLAESLKELPGVTKESIEGFARLRDAFDDQRPLETLIAQFEYMQKLQGEMAGIDNPQLQESFSRMYKELANGIAQLIPLVNAQEGTIDENSEAYKRLMLVLEETGISITALAEIQERIKTANENATEAAIDAAQAERDRQELYDDIRKSLGPMEQIQAKFNDQLAKAGKVAWQSSQDVLAYVDALRVWKAEQETLVGLKLGGEFGGTAAQLREMDFEREVRAPLQSLIAQDEDNPALKEMWEKALEFRELQHQNELDEINNKQTLYDLNQGLLDSTLTLGEAGAGVTTAMAQGFGQVALQSMNLAGNIQQITATAIGGLSRQLGLLATGSKADFKQVATSFVQMIAQMLVQLTAMLAIIGAIKAMGGEGILALMGLGGAAQTAATTTASTVSTTTSSMLNAAAVSAIAAPSLNYPKQQGAAGRPMRAGMPYMVGERGPELFVPPQSGSLKSNREMNMIAQQPPQVTIVNVDSTQNTLDALGSEEGEQLIMNVIQRNPEILRSLG